MGIIARQSIKASVVTYVGIFLGIVNQLFIITYFLTPTQVGLITSLINFGALFATFAGLGGASILDKFYNLYQDTPQKSYGFMGLIVRYMAIGFGVFLVTFVLIKPAFYHLFVQKSPELVGYYYYFIPLTAAVVLQNLFESWCRNQQRIAIPALMRELLLRLLNMLIIVLYGFDFIDFDALVYLYVGQYLALTTALFFYAQSIKKIPYRVNWSAYSRGSFQEMSNFTFYVVLGIVGTSLCTYLDKVMLSALSGQAATGIFGIAFMIAQFIEIPKRSLSQISIPIIAEALRKDDIKAVESMHQKAALNQLLFSSILLIVIWFSIDDVFGLMAKGQVYMSGKYALLFLATAKLIDNAGGFSSEIIGFSKYYRAGLPMQLSLGVLTYFTNTLLIPKYGVTGAGAATALTIVSYTALRAWYVWHQFKISPYSRQTFKALVIIAVTVFLAYLLPNTPSSFAPSPLNSVLAIGLRTAILSAFFGAILFWSKLSPEINEIIMQTLGHLKLTKNTNH